MLWKFKQQVHIIFQVRYCRGISTFRKNMLSPFSGTNIFTWICRPHGPPKRRYPLLRLHGITTQNTATHRHDYLRSFIVSISLLTTAYNGLKLSHLLVSFKSSLQTAAVVIMWYAALPLLAEAGSSLKKSSTTRSCFTWRKSFTLFSPLMRQVAQQELDSYYGQSLDGF